MDEGASPSIDVMDGTPPAKARKGRKSKSSLVPPVPEGSLSGSKPASETSSLTGEGMSVRTGEGFDVDGTVGDDISVLSLDEGMLRYSCYYHANLSDMVATGQEMVKGKISSRSEIWRVHIFVGS